MALNNDTMIFNSLDRPDARAAIYKHDKLDSNILPIGSDVR